MSQDHYAELIFKPEVGVSITVSRLTNGDFGVVIRNARVNDTGAIGLTRAQAQVLAVFLTDGEAK